mmetsp:Transcript_33358/g.50449  ORF Transcript_33358/g.50449 Transcript_33358/m.50449 type:complete len:257 (+) Transcript_33358:73-843(+)
MRSSTSRESTHPTSHGRACALAARDVLTPLVRGVRQSGLRISSFFPRDPDRTDKGLGNLTFLLQSRSLLGPLCSPDWEPLENLPNFRTFERFFVLCFDLCVWGGDGWVDWLILGICPTCSLRSPLWVLLPSSPPPPPCQPFLLVSLLRPCSLFPPLSPSLPPFSRLSSPQFSPRLFVRQQHVPPFPSSILRSPALLHHPPSPPPASRQQVRTSQSSCLLPGRSLPTFPTLPRSPLSPPFQAPAQGFCGPSKRRLRL